MTELKCPFCNEKLVRHWGMEEPALYCCDNSKCSRGGVATESAWQELTRTRKALEIAVDALKYANKCIKGGCVNWETEIDKALEQIEDKE